MTKKSPNPTLKPLREKKPRWFMDYEKGKSEGFKQGQEQERKRCLDILEKWRFKNFLETHTCYLPEFCERAIKDGLKQQIEDTK